MKADALTPSGQETSSIENHMGVETKSTRENKNTVSAREQHYRALARQGHLTDEGRATLKSDLLDLLDTKDRPKSEYQLKEELVRNCGWKWRKVEGPRPFVERCLNELEWDGLAESDTYPSERELSSGESEWWITIEGREAREARITYNAKTEAARLAAQIAQEAEDAAFFSEGKVDK